MRSNDKCGFITDLTKSHVPSTVCGNDAFKFSHCKKHLSMNILYVQKADKLTVVDDINVRRQIGKFNIYKDQNMYSLQNVLILNYINGKVNNNELVFNRSFIKNLNVHAVLNAKIVNSRNFKETEMGFIEYTLSPSSRTS
eukprot:Pgem_evm1s15682